VLAAFALALANFVVVLDITIANVSVPHIAGGLAVSPSQGTWVITSYAVAEAIAVPLTGWLAARFGTYRWLLVSLAGFGIFSALCGAARSIELLIAFRIMQGLCGGPIMPLTQAMLTRVFPPEKVPMAMGLWATTTITAPIFGPILGGWISDNWSWPWIFFINIPVLALSLFAVINILPRFETPRLKLPIDLVGLALLIVWVGAFQLMLDTGREHDWFNSPFVVVMAIVAVIGFAAFVIWEWYEENPVVNLRLFMDRTLAISTVAISLGFAAMFAGVVLVPLWLQQVLGYTATEAGVVTGAQGVLAVFVAPLAALLMAKVDVRVTISLGVLWLAGASLMRLTWSTDSTWWAVVLPQLLQGLGMPFFFVGLTTFSISRVTAQNIASAAGIVTFARTMAGAAATALASTLWLDHAQQQRAELVPAMNGVDQAIGAMQGAGMDHEQAVGTLSMLVEMQAMTNSALFIFGLATILLAASAAIIWLAPKPSDRLKPGPAH
jgi:DHA2 family multidrug resistance protein